ncbi:class I SAM-dependent methyltransferase [Haloferacaceae archaeon DSL9]
MANTVPTPDEYSFVRYLAAKRTVDNRALHRPTLDRLDAALDAWSEANPDEPARILEVGAGIGTMCHRLFDRELLPDRVTYTALDQNPDAVDYARRRTERWADKRGYEYRETAAGAVVRDGYRTVDIAFVTADAFEFVDETADSWQLLVGMSFLDLVDLSMGLEPLLSALEPGGLAYFPITFDGETIFRPVDDDAFEAELLGAYHATMDAPDRPGGSRTGRLLLEALDDVGATIVSAGGSDWVVYPTAGEYQGDEAYFLHHIVDTVGSAVDETGEVDGAALAAWIDRRHGEIARGDLRYIAHQLDVLARV